MARIVEKEQRMFVTGNEVVAWGALAADADIMYGYPITPQNEIMHYWTRLAPRFGKGFLQTEDELSAGFTAWAASWRKKAFRDLGPERPDAEDAMAVVDPPWVIQQRGPYWQRSSTNETRLTCLAVMAKACGLSIPPPPTRNSLIIPSRP